MNLGPATWADKFPEAAGARQSPVNIDTSVVIAGRRSLKHSPLSWSYNPTSVSSIVNSGHGWKVNVDGSGCGETISIVYIFINLNDNGDFKLS